jgi:hypothetical protein
MRRLLHALVVCGAGLVLLQCGRTTRDRDKALASSGAVAGSSEPAHGGDRSASGGADHGGAHDGSGGSPDHDRGGEEASGGAETDLGLAGAASGGPSEQWSCDPRYMWCPDVGTPALLELSAEHCVRDATRPASAADCDSDHIFSCMAGVLDGVELLFNCECASPGNLEKPYCPCPELDSRCFDEVAPQQCGDASECRCTPFICDPK